MTQQNLATEEETRVGLTQKGEAYLFARDAERRKQKMGEVQMGVLGQEAKRQIIQAIELEAQQIVNELGSVSTFDAGDFLHAKMVAMVSRMRQTTGVDASILAFHLGMQIGTKLVKIQEQTAAFEVDETTEVNIDPSWPKGSQG